jgi:hypothetical protein
MVPHAPHDRRQTPNRNPIKIQNTGQKTKPLIPTTNKNPTNYTSFYPRVIKTTDTTFSEQEMMLLEKGPKYNLHAKPKDWIRNLTLEAETAITHLPPHRPRSLQKTDSQMYKHPDKGK